MVRQPSVPDLDGRRRVALNPPAPDPHRPGSVFRATHVARHELPGQPAPKAAVQRPIRPGTSLASFAPEARRTHRERFKRIGVGGPCPATAEAVAGKRHGKDGGDGRCGAGRCGAAGRQRPSPPSPCRNPVVRHVPSRLIRFGRICAPQHVCLTRSPTTKPSASQKVSLDRQLAWVRAVRFPGPGHVRGHIPCPRCQLTSRDRTGATAAAGDPDPRR